MTALLLLKEPAGCDSWGPVTLEARSVGLMGSAGQLPLSFFYAFIDSGFFQTVLLILEIRKVKPRNRNSRLPPPSVSVTEEGCGAQALPTAPCLLHLQNATRCSWSAHPRLRDFTGQLRNFSRNRQRLSNTLLCQERMLKKNKEHCHYHLFNIITEPAGNTPAPRESEDRVGANRLFATSFQTSCPPPPFASALVLPCELASWPFFEDERSCESQGLFIYGSLSPKHRPCYHQDLFPQITQVSTKTSSARRGAVTHGILYALTHALPGHLATCIVRIHFIFCPHFNDDMETRILFPSMPKTVPGT